MQSISSTFSPPRIPVSQSCTKITLGGWLPLVDNLAMLVQESPIHVMVLTSGMIPY